MFHHSFLTIAPSSAVGFCCHCAFHLARGKDALTFNKSSFCQNCGQSGLSDGIIAGNSTISHSSDMISEPCALISLPVKSFKPHRVITTIIEPPGCKRCLGPEVYHSYALSNAVSDNASCSECGSSIINKSAPRPVTAAPTPAAKYSPPSLVSQRPAALLSAFKSVFGNTSL